MEFKRFEVRRILRHSERVEDSLEISKLLEAIKSHGLKCSAKVKDIGISMKECAVLDVDSEGGKALLYSREPSKIKAWFGFAEIEAIEVECCLDLLVDVDDGGRWARIL